MSNDESLHTDLPELPPESEILPNATPVTMEVHHHPDLLHEKKYLREYFLEFITIFLAVTLSYFAENAREQIRDHKLVIQSMQSLTQDLNADAAMYDSSMAVNLNNCRMIDTLITLMYFSPFINGSKLPKTPKTQ